MITNLFEAAHERAVLVNYTTYPFLHRPGGHPNHYESHLIARAFHDRGYRVDVADFADDTPIDLTPYDVLFGFGQAFERSFTAAHRPGVKRIYYATGAHVSHQNPAEIARVRAVNRRHGTRLLPQRVVPWCWSLSTSLSDAVIVLGNDWVASTYRPFTDAPVHSLATTALFHPDGARIERDYARRPLGLLWFGSAGFVHKGLDVCLEYAAADPGIRLHVCAAKEPAFMDAFAAYFRLPNVAYHRFVDVCSPTFARIVSECAACILPSCSEAGATSLLTAMATGLVPIGTRFTGVDIDRLGVEMDEISAAAVGRAVARVRGMSPEELAARDRALREHCLAVHSPPAFAAAFGRLIAECLA